MYEIGMQLALTFLIGGVMGFLFGHRVTKFPSEELMMDRLIIAATERRMLGVTKEDIEVKIEAGVVANMKR